MKKLTGIILIVAVSIVLFCSTLLSAFESPLSIFLPSVEETGDIDENGQEIIGFQYILDELIGLYADLETTVNNMVKSAEHTEVTNTLNRDNLADVAIIYAIRAASDEKTGTNPCDFKSSTYGKQNRQLLKNIFNMMNTYSSDTTRIEVGNGGLIGSYSISVNDDSIYYNPDDEYGECLLTTELLAIIPLGTHISIDGVVYQVVGTISGIDEQAVSICKSSAESSSYNGQLCNVYFASVPGAENYSYDNTKLTYVQYTAKDFMDTYSLTDEEKDYYREITKEIDKLKTYAQNTVARFSGNTESGAGAGTGGNGNTYTDLSNIEPVKPNESQAEFIDSIGKAAVSYYNTYHILPSLTIAQAILESGWGKSGLASYHNYFGMKYSASAGTASVTRDTMEQREDGSYIKINAQFRAYSSRSEGIKGYYDFLQYPRYRNLTGVTDYREATTLIRQDGWATSLSYTQDLQRIIVQYSLTDYDKMAGAI